MEEQKVTALINLGQGKVLEKVYDDLVSPVTQKAGQALATLMDIGNTIMAPIKFLNSKCKLYFDNNLKNYQEKLEKVSIENIVEVPTEISAPILERFSYVTNKDLGNAFTRLLLTASNADTASLAHPSFISIIDRLSPDEAKLLSIIKHKAYIPIGNARAYKKQNGEFRNLSDRSGLEFEANLTFPENIQIYLENLQSLGLIERQTYYRTDEESYQRLFEKYPNELDALKQHLNDEFEEPEWSRGVYEITEYGRLFMKAAIE